LCGIGAKQVGCDAAWINRWGGEMELGNKTGLSRWIIVGIAAILVTERSRFWIFP
jgi:hypothetical protein